MVKNDKSTATPRLRFPEFRETEGWEKSELGSIATILKGKGISKSDVVVDGLRPCIRYGELYTRYGEVIDTVHSRTNAPVSDLILSHKNDVIIPASGETKLDIAKASCVLQEDVALGGDLNILRTSHNGVFLSYLLNSSKRYEIARVAQGDTVVHLYPSQLQEINVATTSPAEQQKIADCLMSLDEVIAAQGRKVEALKAHKRGLMQQLFPREGETLPRLRFPEFRDELEWESRTLGEIASISSGSTPLRSNPEFYDGGTIPWVKTTDLNNSFIDVTEECITPMARVTINPVGAVVVAMYGGFNQIGRTGYLRVSAATNQALSVLRVDHEKVLPIYLLFWLNAKVNDWKRIASSSRKDPNITGTDVARFPIQIPTLAEQQRIADCLSYLDAMSAAESKKLDALKPHKKGLMQQLFPATEDTMP